MSHTPQPGWQRIPDTLLRNDRFRPYVLSMNNNAIIPLANGAQGLYILDATDIVNRLYAAFRSAAGLSPQDFDYSRDMTFPDGEHLVEELRRGLPEDLKGHIQSLYNYDNPTVEERLPSPNNDNLQSREEDMEPASTPDEKFYILATGTALNILKIDVSSAPEFAGFQEYGVNPLVAPPRPPRP